MKRTKKAIVFLIVLAMTVAIMPLVSQAAALTSPLTIVPLSSNSPSYHRFRVSNTNSADVDFSWTAGSLSGSGSVGANASATITVNLPLSQKVECTISWNNGETNLIASARSNGEYSVTVKYVNTATGATLDEKSGISKSSDPYVHIAPKTLKSGGVQYKLTSSSDVWNPGYDTSLAGSTYTFNYAEVTPEPYTITVNRVNAATNEVITFSRPDIEVGGSKTVTVPESFEKDGVEYKLAAGQSTSVTHNYGDATRTYNFFYNALPASPDSPYMINVRYIDAATGNAIYSKSISVPVKTAVTHDVPAKYVTDSGKTYVKQSGEPTQIKHESYDTTRVYIVKYDLDTSVPSSDYEIKVNYVGAVTGTTLESINVNVPLNGIGRHSLPASITVGGKLYDLATGQGNEIVHPFAELTRVYTVYYTPTDGGTPAPYTISIRYANAIDRTLLNSLTLTVTASGVTHTAPATLTAGGDEYKYSAGQVASVIHSYNNVRREYTLFYNPVVKEPTPTSSTTPTYAPTEEPVITPAPSTPQVTPTPTPTPAVSETSQPTESPVVIAPTEVPLAGPGGTVSPLLLVGGAIILLSGAAFGLILLLRRRRRHNEG